MSRGSGVGMIRSRRGRNRSKFRSCGIRSRRLASLQTGSQLGEFTAIFDVEFFVLQRHICRAKRELCVEVPGDSNGTQEQWC